MVEVIFVLWLEIYFIVEYGRLVDVFRLYGGLGLIGSDTKCRKIWRWKVEN